MRPDDTLEPRAGCSSCSGRGWVRGPGGWPTRCQACYEAQLERKRMERAAAHEQALRARRRAITGKAEG